MSASSQQQSFRRLFLVFFILFFARSCIANFKVTYACYKQSNNPYVAVYVEIGDVYDIFAKGAEDSCGMRAQNMTGRGSENVPYRLNVNLTGVGDVNPGVCGVIKKGDLVNLTIVIRTENGTLSSGTERESKIFCDFSNVALVNSNVKMNFVEEKAEEENINITLRFDGSPSELTVGTETFLVMRMWTLTRFSVVESFRCWAMRNSTDANKILLSDNYCPVSTAPIVLKFKHTERYSAVQTEPFKVFRFFDSNVLLIRCIADICFTPDSCFKVNCASRKKRSVVYDGRGRHIARAEASITVRDARFSNVFDGTQLPFLGTIGALSVIIVILGGIAIILAVKLHALKPSR